MFLPKFTMPARRVAALTLALTLCLQFSLGAAPASAAPNPHARPAPTDDGTPAEDVLAAVKRALRGTDIPGLSVASFIRSALNAKLQGIDKDPEVDPTDSIKGGVSMRDFRNRMREKMGLLRMDEGFASRYVNEGFSGGEKKRLEMLQMAVLEPEMAILDETDSGLDIDALRIVAEGVNAMLNPNLGVLLITHYQRLLNYITPDVVHVLAQGRIVKSGGKDLALRLEDEGYGPILREAGLSPDLPDEALLVPQGPDLEPVESARFEVECVPGRLRMHLPADCPLRVVRGGGEPLP